MAIKVKCLHKSYCCKFEVNLATNTCLGYYCILDNGLSLCVIMPYFVSVEVQGVIIISFMKFECVRITDNGFMRHEYICHVKIDIYRSRSDGDGWLNV